MAKVTRHLYLAIKPEVPGVLVGGDIPLLCLCHVLVSQFGIKDPI